MQIIELIASNFARLKAIEIRPAGALVPITGKNSQGKTTVLRAIWTALKGKAAAPPRPIRDDAEEAIIKLDLGDMRIVRKFTRDDHGETTSELTVYDATGGKVRRSPQAMIDAIIGDLSFDPLAFSKLKPVDQFERLKALVPGIDFDAIARKRQRVFDDRTIENRDAKEQHAIAINISLPAGPEPGEINIADAMEELQGLQAANQKRQTMLSSLEAKRVAIETRRAQARDLHSRYQILCGQIATEEAAADALARIVGEELDTAPLMETISSAQRINQVRGLFEARRRHMAQAEAHEQASAKLTDEITALDAGVRDAIAKAKLPAGVSLDPEAKIVLRDGVPFSEAGTADKIVTSAQIAMALNPDLRVMLIDEGSELDSAHVALLERLANSHEYQIWIAKVEEGEGGAGFRIEDGTITTSPKVIGSARGLTAAVSRSKEKPEARR